MEPVDYARADAYFINANVFGIVFADGFDNEPGSAHGVEFLVLVEGYDVVALADANDGAVGPEPGHVDADFDWLGWVRERSLVLGALRWGMASWPPARLVADRGFYLGERY